MGNLPWPIRDDLHIHMQFIELLCRASHENSQLPEDLLDRIYNPLSKAFDMEDADVRLCVSVFIHTQNGS
jgi:hypothetical protein